MAKKPSSTSAKTVFDDGCDAQAEQINQGNIVDGVQPNGDVIYGRVKFNKPCPRCSDPSTQTLVFTKATSTQGPIVWVKCPNNCGYGTHITRPMKQVADFFKEMSVAVRPDMD